MQLDAATIPRDSDLSFDLCIVGAGPAGLAIASEFVGSGLQVALLESGGFHRDRRVERLSEGRNRGAPYFRLSTSHLRMVGGSSNHWLGEAPFWSVDGGMRSRPLDALDLEHRPWVSGSGWPLTAADLAPYYVQAHRLCGLSDAPYDPHRWTSPHGPSPLALTPSLLETTTARFGRAKVFGDLADAATHAPNVSLITRATVTHIRLSPDSSAVDHVRVTTLAGNMFTVRARSFVVAGGGIENARLLLASCADHPSGLGNQRDLVGRFFTEHLEVESGVFRPAAGFRLSQLGFYRRHLFQVEAVVGLLRLPDEVQRREGLLDGVASFRPRQDLFLSSPVRSFAELLFSLAERSRPAHLGAHIRTAASSPASITRAAYRRLRNTHTRHIRAATMVLTSEQEPNAASRVTLSNSRDSLGMPFASLDWRLTALDRRSLRRTQELLDLAFRQAGIGRIENLLGDSHPPPRIVGCMHHIGTTRMSASESQGVVNRDCRVHGIPNLYVAGSSVFPTAGATTVTLTIVALALRLASHLRQTLGVNR